MEKVLVIGLDGATFEIIGPWIASNELPTLAGLIREGVTATLNSTIMPASAPAWASFSTGKNPGKHGVYDFTERCPDSYNVRLVNAASVQGDRLWDIAGREGRRVGVINMPLTYPPRQVNGFLVTGLLTPPHAAFTYPGALGDELRRALGGYRIFEREAYCKADPKRYLNDLYDLLDHRTAAIKYLMQNHPWDLFIAVYMVTDHLAHKFGAYLDPNHPAYDSAWAAKLGNVFFDFYKVVDSSLSDLLSSVSDDTVIMVMSDHGTGPLYKQLYVNKWLMQEGLLEFKKNPVTWTKRMLMRGNIPGRVYGVFQRFSFSSALRLTRLVPRNRRAVLMNSFLTPADIDWQNTKVYHHGAFGQLYVNLKGREPQGIVEPGTEHEEVLGTVKERLLALCDSTTGERVVSNVYLSQEIYWGPLMNKAPDLLFVLKDMEYVTTERFGPEDHSLFADHSADYATGTHRQKGIFVIKGPGIRQRMTIDEVQIVDLAPMILHLLDVPIPDDMDGQIRKEVFEPSFFKMRSPRYVTGRSSEDFYDGYADEHEYEEVADRLRGLGYL